MPRLIINPALVDKLRGAFGCRTELEFAESIGVAAATLSSLKAGNPVTFRTIDQLLAAAKLKQIPVERFSDVFSYR